MRIPTRGLLAATLLAAPVAGCGGGGNTSDVQITIVLPNDYDQNPPDLSAEKRTDRYVQIPADKVDILWVIDNSGTMAEEQQQLVNNFRLFMDYLFEAQVDYHVAIVTTGYDSRDDFGRINDRGELRPHHVDPVDREVVNLNDEDEYERWYERTFNEIYDQRKAYYDATPDPDDEPDPLELAAEVEELMPELEPVHWIEPSTSDPLAAFVGAGVVGTNGPSTERGRAQVYHALEYTIPEKHAGFLRDDASLVVVFLSDEDDESGDDPIAEADFVPWLAGLKEDPLSQLRVHAIVADALTRPNGEPLVREDGSLIPCSGSPDRPEVGGIGEAYVGYAEAFGGVTYSICEKTWKPALEAIGFDSAGYSREFYLAEVPVTDSVGVRTIDFHGEVDEEGNPVVSEKVFKERLDWAYDRARNSIRFIDAYYPGPLAEVFIDYEVLSDAQLLTEEPEE